jgi:alpha-tubulin suppressor-like RCC1 family protein
MTASTKARGAVQHRILLSLLRVLVCRRTLIGLSPPSPRNLRPSECLKAWFNVLAAILLAGHDGIAAAQQAPRIAAGGNTSFAVSTDGRLYGWGTDQSGQLGQGRVLQTSTPQRVVGAGGYKTVAAGYSASFALKANGDLYGWGDNSYGRLGDGTSTDRSTPTFIGGGYQAVATGLFHTIALKANGDLYAWGLNDSGQLGDGTTTDRATPTLIGSGYSSIAAGSNYSIALKANGDLYAWGLNDSGQLGDGTTTNRASPTFIGIGYGTEYRAIAAGDSYTVALKVNGDLYAWGYNGYGQLGDRTTLDRARPTFIGSGFQSVAAGSEHSVALKANGDLYAWGQNSLGQLGDGTETDRSTPTFIGGGYQSVATGAYFTIALKANGDLYAWGDNRNGQLGDGTIYERWTPTLIGSGYQAVAPGSYHMIALRTNGDLYAWGDNRSGELGDGTALDKRLTPTLIGIGYQSVAAAADYTIALKANGDLYAWGFNGYGGLGDGTFTDQSSPTFIGSGYKSVAAGTFHTVALKANGDLYAWGSNLSGELGLGTSGDYRTTPIFVDSGYQSVATGGSTPGDRTMALKVSGDLYAWGSNNSGALGDGTFIDRSRPTFIGSGYKSVAAGPFHSIALKANGDLYAWGYNGYGQLGDGTTTNRPAPTLIGSGYQAIAAGFFHTIALKANGDLYAWGSNLCSELGLGTSGDYLLTPTLVASGFQAIAAGGCHTIALRSDGTVWAWGSNGNGEIGDGTFALRPKPVVVVSENGAGSIQTNDWFLALNPGIVATIPSDKIPAFLLVASGNVTSNSASATANIRFRTQDLGHPIYVFGYVPASLVKRTAEEKDGATCVLAQLTPSGQAQQVSASGLQSYASNVTSTQGQSVNVINNILSPSVAGATFCVGTAGTSAQAADPGNSRCVATVPPAASGGQICVEPSSSSGPLAISYQGLWLKGDESGWGVNVTHQRTTLFATWFTYDSDGTGMWLVASSVAQTSAGNFTGTLYRTVGPAFSANPFNSISFPANYTQVGTLTLSFTDANTGTMSYTVNGVTQSKAITRYVYVASPPTCILGGTQGSSPNYQDLWLRSATGTTEAGWGVNITHQGDILFATWFTYLAGSGATNKGIWLVMSNGNKTAPGVYTGALQTTTGPAFSAVPFNPNNVARTTVGSGTFTFTDANNGTFSYIVNGVTQSKPIARYIYATPTTVCQ